MDTENDGDLSCESRVLAFMHFSKKNRVFGIKIVFRYENGVVGIKMA